jgi:hypothetical protein
LRARVDDALTETVRDEVRVLADRVVAHPFFSPLPA